jgi:hypothetical protein
MLQRPATGAAKRPVRLRWPPSRNAPGAGTNARIVTEEVLASGSQRNYGVSRVELKAIDRI